VVQGKVAGFFEVLAWDEALDFHDTTMPSTGYFTGVARAHPDELEPSRLSVVASLALWTAI
jgi:hypothetical protein